MVCRCGFWSTTWWEIVKNIYFGISTATSIKSINPFCWYQPFDVLTCVLSCDHPFTKHLDSFNSCVQQECMRYCNEVPLVHVELHIAEFWLIVMLSLPVTKYIKSPNRSEFSPWSAIVSAADMPWSTPSVTALIVKAEINGRTRWNWYNVWISFSMFEGKRFLAFHWCWYWTKRNSFGLIASPWHVTPFVMNAFTSNYDGICGKCMSSSCSFNVAE